MKIINGWLIIPADPEDGTPTTYLQIRNITCIQIIKERRGVLTVEINGCEWSFEPDDFKQMMQQAGIML